MTIRFDGRVAIVTGAGKGLGRAYAELLGERGCAILVNNRRRDGEPSSADETVAAIRMKGGRAVANYDSVEDEAGAIRMVEQAIAAFGQLDIVLNNAGVGHGITLHKMSVAEFKRVMDINFYGSLYLTHAALPHLRRRNYGRIIMSTSSAGLYSNHGMTAYAASKAALIGLGRGLAMEGLKNNINVNIIAPFAYTPMTAQYHPTDESEAQSPHKVAPVVAWLLSEECGITGETIVASAGAFRRAEAIESHGVTLKGGDLTPEGVAAAWPRIADMKGAHTFANAHLAYQDIVEMATGRKPGV